MIRRSRRLVGHLLLGAYAITRIFTVIYLAITVVLGEVGSFDTCRILARFIGAANLVIMPAISGLFFVRLSAIYSRDKYVMAFFGSCWLCILCIFIYDTTQVLSRFSQGNVSMECFSVRPPDAWGYMGTAIYDTLMYLAISWRLASFNMTNHWKARVRSFLTGGGLTGLPKVLLHRGQVYYFLTIGFTICNAVFIDHPRIPPEWHNLLLEPNIAIASILACRLFRELKLGLFEDPMTEGAMSNIVFQDLAKISRQQSGHVLPELCTYDGAETDASGNTASDAWDIENPGSSNVASEKDGGSGVIA